MKPKKISRLAKHPGIWRVDGIVAVSDVNRLGTRATAYFSKIFESMIGDPFKKTSIMPADGTEEKERLALKIHVAQARMLKVGTLWQDGKRIRGVTDNADTPYEVNASAMRLVKLNESIEINGSMVPSILPQTYFYIPEENRKFLAETYYALIPVLNNPQRQWIVIPAIEVLRFYYGISTRFLSSSIKDSLSSYVRWDKSHMVDDVAKVHTKSRLNRKELFTAARCLASDVAMSRLRAIHKNLAAIQANNSTLASDKRRPLSVQARFPFDGTTNIVVSGKKMPLVAAPKGEWAIFAMEIRHCTHSPGFASIEEVCDEPATVRGRTTGYGGIPIYDPSKDEEETIDDVPADNRLKRATTLSYGNQFRDFSNIKITRLLSEEGKKRSHKEYGPAQDLPVHTQTHNDGTSSSEDQGNRGVNNYQSHMVANRKLSQFLQMIIHLQKLTKATNWRFKTLTNEATSILESGHFITSFPRNMGSKRRRWHLIEFEDSKTLPRQLVWVEVFEKIRNEYLYILEMELKHPDEGQCTLITWKTDRTAFTEVDLYNLLFLTAINNRWPPHSIEEWKHNKYQNEATAFYAVNKLLRMHHPDRPTISQDEKVGDDSGKFAKYIEQWAEDVFDVLEDIRSIA